MTSDNHAANAIVRPDSYLTLHYRIEVVSGAAAGTIFADTFLDRPATLQMGCGQWAPGLESVLLNRYEGEHFTVRVPAVQAYGERNPDLVQWVSRQLVDAHTDPEAPLEAGEMIEFTAPNGGRYSGVLKEVTDKRVLFDFNHPLAGVDIELEVSLLGVL